jgi:polyisoprenoid-binding protein YceI
VPAWRRTGSTGSRDPFLLVSRRGVLVVAAGVLVALALAGGYGLWYLFLRGVAPAAIGAAGGSDASTLPSAAVPSSSPLPSGGLPGTWTVDTSVGSSADWSDSFVGYRVQEQLAGIGANTAVGRTPQVSGTLTIDGTTVTAARINADLTALRSDDQRRDGQLRRQALQTAQFPTAEFTLSEPIDLRGVPRDGQRLDVTAKGQLTLHGVTKDVSVSLTAWLAGSRIVVQGSLPITFADYGIEKPSSFAVLSVADQGTMELQLFFVHG